MTDPEFEKVEPWIRTTFILCASLAGVGTALAFPLLLWALMPIAALGAIFPIHPFDLIYNYGLRHLTGTGELPRNGAPTRFACGLASVWLVATALSFHAGVDPLGYALGGTLTAIAITVATTQFCIPSFVYHFLFGDRALAWRALVGGPRPQA